MPDTNGVVQGTPELPYQPYDATDASSIGKWQSVDENSGPADMNGKATGDFESGSGWKQT